MFSAVVGICGLSIIWLVPLLWRLARRLAAGVPLLGGAGTIRFWVGAVVVLASSSLLETELARLLGWVGGGALGHALARAAEHLGMVLSWLVPLVLLITALPWFLDFGWRTVLSQFGLASDVAAPRAREIRATAKARGWNSPTLEPRGPISASVESGKRLRGGRAAARFRIPQAGAPNSPNSPGALDLHNSAGAAAASVAGVAPSTPVARVAPSGSAATPGGFNHKASGSAAPAGVNRAAAAAAHSTTVITTTAAPVARARPVHQGAPGTAPRAAGVLPPVLRRKSPGPANFPSGNATSNVSSNAAGISSSNASGHITDRVARPAASTALGSTLPAASSRGPAVSGWSAQSGGSGLEPVNGSRDPASGAAAESHGASARPLQTRLTGTAPSAAEQATLESIARKIALWNTANAQASNEQSARSASSEHAPSSLPIDPALPMDATPMAAAPALEPTRHAPEVFPAVDPVRADDVAAAPPIELAPISPAAQPVAHPAPETPAGYPGSITLPTPAIPITPDTPETPVTAASQAAPGNALPSQPIPLTEPPLAPAEQHDASALPRVESNRPFGVDQSATVAGSASTRPVTSNVVLPPLDLLAGAGDAFEPISSEQLAETGQLIEQRLREFKVPVTVVGASAGPVITRFEVEPAVGVRGSQIVGLMKDLSRGLGLTSIRVVETIPGKTCMGLELPNARRLTIRLAQVLADDAYRNASSHLSLAMGQDITGQPVVVDLARAPHMLVAGTTGSGKSVAINAMILSLLFKATPDQVRLIMIDPKMLELSVYEGIPHLLAPVVTDMKLAANALNWCVGEMERRYRLMSALGVRNLAGFNQKIENARTAGRHVPNPFSLTPEAPEPLTHLPLIVVMIDELADLMMVAGKKIEELIARLAQKARAAGIHLILATQRPSVDVITGLIKANIPTRVAFQVSSKIDSRTILDQMGAESLLGQGDMLFLPPGSGYPQRVHGAFVADDEVHRVVEYLKQFGEPHYEESLLVAPPDENGSSDLFGDAPDIEADPLYDEAVAHVLRTRRASISSVQRQLRIGYNRAARLIEQMESSGLVSSMNTNGSRDVLAPGPES